MGREGVKKSVEGNIGTLLQAATDKRGGEQVEPKNFNPRVFFLASH